MTLEHFELMHKILNIIEKYEELDNLINSLTKDEFRFFLKLLEKSET